MLHLAPLNKEQDRISFRLRDTFSISYSYGYYPVMQPFVVEGDTPWIRYADMLPSSWLLDAAAYFREINALVYYPLSRHILYGHCELVSYYHEDNAHAPIYNQYVKVEIPRPDFIEKFPLREHHKRESLNQLLTIWNLTMEEL